MVPGIVVRNPYVLSGIKRWECRQLVVVNLKEVLIVGTNLHVSWLVAFSTQVAFDHGNNLVGHDPLDERLSHGRVTCVYCS